MIMISSCTLENILLKASPSKNMHNSRLKKVGLKEQLLYTYETVITSTYDIPSLDPSILLLL